MKLEQKQSFSADRELMHTLFLQREYNISHLAYESELAFYHAVKEGDLDRVKQIMLPLKNEQLGKLSDNPLRNIKYHLIVTIALVTRFCIEGGMLSENAYTLSDIYIQKLDRCTTEDEITLLHRQAVLDFTRKMNELKKEPQFSPTIIRTIDYVYDHLHERILLDEIAAFHGLNKTYLCGLFKKETGLTLGDYITNRKIEAARNMLTYSDYPAVTISSYLAFSSHSHFIQVFRKKTGLTPREYRSKHYRSHFTG